MEFKIVLEDGNLINIKGTPLRIRQEMFEDICKFTTVSGKVLFVAKNKILFVLEKDDS